MQGNMNYITMNLRVKVFIFATEELTSILLLILIEESVIIFHCTKWVEMVLRKVVNSKAIVQQSRHPNILRSSLFMFIRWKSCSPR